MAEKDVADAQPAVQKLASDENEAVKPAVVTEGARKVVEKEVVEHNTVEKEAVEKEAEGKEAVENEAEEKVETEAEEKEAVEKEAEEEDAVEKEAVGKDAVEKEAVEKEAVEMEVVEKEAVDKEALEKETGEEEASVDATDVATVPVLDAADEEGGDDEPEEEEESTLDPKILKAKAANLYRGKKEYVEFHPRRFDREMNSICNYRELLNPDCKEFLSLTTSMTVGWSNHNMATFVYSRNPDGSLRLNEEKETMFCAPDGQHRVMCQVRILLTVIFKGL